MKMLQNTSLFNTLAICIILIYKLIFYGSTAQVCTESGRTAGLDVKGYTGGSYNANNTQILHEYGGINCYGVLTEWNFYKNYDCANVYFQIWRRSGSDYVLVGQNFYNQFTELCDVSVRGPVTLRIPKHEQVPVQPGDIIGWTSPLYNEMIEYLTGLSNGTMVQSVTLVCKDTQDRPTTPGFNTASCTTTSPSFTRREVSLQAVVVTGPAPVFDNLPNVVQIPENSIAGSPVGFLDKVFDVKASIEKNVVANAIDVDLVFSFSSPQLYFDISTESNTDPDFIGNNMPYTGRVTLIQPLDYESQQEHIIPIRVDGLGQYSESTLTVQVIHINEPHTITNLPFTTNVNAETATVGEVVFRVDVFDDDANPDALTYGIYSTDILDPPPPFKMNNKTGILTVSEDLYGMVLPTQYELELSAWDFMYTDIQTLTIQLDNVRVNPVISNLDEYIQVPEDAPTGSDIFQVVADSRYPDEIEYTILGVTPFEMFDKFMIDPQSGWIRTTISPDFDYGDKTQYPIDIEIEVKDDVGSDTGILTIDLLWINSPPLFTPSAYTADIPEKCGEEQNPGNCNPDVANPWTIPGLTLNIEHRDEGTLPDNPGPADTAACSILPGFASSMFTVDNCMYLELIEVIDVNDHPKYMTINLTLLVEDDYGLSDTADVFLTVYDINDHSPVLSQNSYSATIQENNDGGMSVLSVSATDDDFGENATIVYSLRNINPYNGTFYFQIDPYTGVIYTKNPADYEFLMTEIGNNVIEFVVRATDQGLQPNYDESAVFITVENVNDNRPSFECLSNKRTNEPVDPDYQCFYNEDTRSDTLVGYTVLLLNAYDVVPENLIPTYYFLNPMRHFALNTTRNNRGDLHTISPLLVYHKYMMICMVEDQGYPKLNARPPVIVRVDTFPPEKHLVDITIDSLIGDFNGSSTIEGFMTEMAMFIEPWYPRLSSVSGETDRTVVTVYALTDNSTFLYENLDQPKHFVHVNDLLRKLRKNIYGDPRNDFIAAMDPIYTPVLVMPTIPNWWIHTIPGLVTTCLLLFLLLLFIIIALTLICRYNAVCCFKKRRHRPTTHAWMNDKRYMKQTDSKTNILKDTDDDDSRASDDDSKGDTDEPFSYSAKGTNKGSRRDSSSTIHSRIYVTSKD